MRDALLKSGLALAMAFAATAASANVSSSPSTPQASADYGAIVVAQRKDVDQGSRPPPPSGPSSQTTTCNPSSVDCP